MEGEARHFTLTLEGLAGAEMSSPDLDGQPKGQSFDIAVDADKLRAVKIFVEVPRGNLSAPAQDFRFKVTSHGGDVAETRETKTIFHGPKQ